MSDDKKHVTVKYIGRDAVSLKRSTTIADSQDSQETYQP
jgi:hypothetical protein